jgi:hypothetical protein
MSPLTVTPRFQPPKEFFYMLQKYKSNPVAARKSGKKIPFYHNCMNVN